MEHIISFSGGIGSYCTARRVVDKYGPESVTLLFADTLIEDEDLYRFLEDAKRALGAKFVRLCDGRTPWEVFKDERFLANSRIDVCSKILKRNLIDSWIKANYTPEECRIYVGIDWNEEHRYLRLAPRKLPYIYLAPMLEPPLLLKEQMLDLLKADGIEPPRLYRMGFAHNNCGGFCVKAGQGHFKRLLTHMPERYKEHEEKEQEFQRFIGQPVTIMRKMKDGVKFNYSLKQLRQDVQCGEQIDEFDIGGCGCAFEPDESEIREGD